jgi:hypothetical protein
MLPAGLDVKIDAIQDIDDYTKPLVVRYLVSGPIGNSTGKRLLVPSDMFVSNAKPTFSGEADKRTTPIYFPYARMTQDVVRIKFPDTVALESAPAKDSYTYKKLVGYNIQTESTANSVTVRRDFVLGNILFEVKEYPDLRAFYSQFETKDQEPLVLTHKQPQAAANELPKVP